MVIEGDYSQKSLKSIAFIVERASLCVSNFIGNWNVDEIICTKYKCYWTVLLFQLSANAVSRCSDQGAIWFPIWESHSVSLQISILEVKLVTCLRSVWMLLDSSTSFILWGCEIVFCLSLSLQCCRWICWLRACLLRPSEQQVTKASCLCGEGIGTLLHCAGAAFVVPLVCYHRLEQRNNSLRHLLKIFINDHVSWPNDLHWSNLIVVHVLFSVL